MPTAWGEPAKTVRTAGRTLQEPSCNGPPAAAPRQGRAARTRDGAMDPRWLVPGGHTGSRPAMSSGRGCRMPRRRRTATGCGKPGACSVWRASTGWGGAWEIVGCFRTCDGRGTARCSRCGTGSAAGAPDGGSALAGSDGTAPTVDPVNPPDSATTTPGRAARACSRRRCADPAAGPCVDRAAGGDVWLGGGPELHDGRGHTVAPAV